MGENKVGIVLAAFFLLAGAALGVVGGISRPWYQTRIGTVTTSQGLFKTCATSGGTQVCADNQYTDQTSCERTGDSLKTRITTVFALTIIGSVFGLISFGLVIGFCCSNSSCPGASGLMTTVFALACQAISVALFAYTIENWYFCDKEYCEFAQLTDCDNSYGMSFLLCAVAVALYFFAMILHAIALCTAEPDDAAAAAPAASRAASPGEPYKQPEQEQAYYGGEEAAAADDGPGGDYVWDEDAQLYWSDAEQLYLDTNTGKYYDPSYQAWYDPATGAWE